MVPSDGRAEQMSLMYVNRVANLGTSRSPSGTPAEPVASFPMRHQVQFPPRRMPRTTANEVPGDLFNGQGYSGRPGAAPRTVAREAAPGHRDRPRSPDLRPGPDLLSSGKLVSRPVAHSNCAEADRSLLAR